MPSTGNLRYSAPVAITTARAETTCPLSSVMRWRSEPGDSPTARYGVAVRAPNLRAWVIARVVSSLPEMPPGNPR